MMVCFVITFFFNLSFRRYVYFAEKGVSGVTSAVLDELISRLKEEMQTGLEAGTDEAEQVIAANF